MELFDSSKTYAVNDQVIYDDKVYECLVTAPNTSINPDVSLDWKESYVLVSGMILKPYIESISQTIVKDQMVTNITITGANFDNTVEVIVDDHDTTILSSTPTEIVFSLTSTTTLGVFPLHVLKSGISHYGLSIDITVTDVVLGSGPAGTWVTDFNSSGGANGQTAFGPDWNLVIGSAVNGIDTFYVTSNAGTPSGTTGPDAPYDSYYIFTERSNPNNGSNADSYIETTNFRDLTELSFYVHMCGSAIGDLVIYSQNSDNTWTERNRQVGQIQSSQSDPFVQRVYDTTTWDCKAIRIAFENCTGYQGDIALDNITLTSV